MTIHSPHWVKVGEEPCNYCKATGIKNDEPCTNCNGTGQQEIGYMEKEIGYCDFIADDIR